MMKTIRDVVYAKTWLCAAVPIVLSAVLVVVTICFVGPVYATIDDARVLYVTAGYASGEPEGVYLFSNALWGQFLASLYGVVPSINWYFMYQILSVIYGCSIVGVTLMLFGRKLRAPLGIILSVHILFFVVMYQNAIMLIHFEVCAAMWGASGVGLLLLLDVASTRWQRVFVSALSAASMLLCYMQEENTFYASLVFYLLVTLFHLMSACFRFERGSRARIILSLGVTAGCVLVGTLSLAAYGSAAMDDRWADYLEYNPYRVAYWDYEHASYAEDPDVYEAAGWSEEFYEATQYMYFMDERFDAARLSEIVKPFNRLTSSVDESALTSIPKTLYGLFKAEVLTRWQALLGGAVCLLATLTFFESRKCAHVSLEALLCLGGALVSVVLCLYLAWRGRLPLRAWEVIALPGVTVCLGSCLRLLCSGGRGRQSRVRCNKAARVGVAAVIALMTCVALSDIQPYVERLNANIRYRDEYNKNVIDVELYAMQHPSNIYITGYRYQNYNPQTLYTGAKPVNVVTWGSSYYMTPVYCDQMARNGRKPLRSEDLLTEGVYLIVNMENTDDIEAVFEMLKTDWGAQTLYPVESINDQMWVYKVE